MRAVNLLPRESAKQRSLITRRNAPALVGAGVGVLVAGSLALGFVDNAGKIGDARARLANVETQLAATPAPPRSVVEANGVLAGEHSARLAAVSTALGGRLAWDRILREFSLVLPPDVWLDSLALTTPTASVAGTTPTGLSMTGTTYSHAGVARLLARLALIPELSDVSLTDSKLGAAASSGDASSAGTGAAASVSGAGTVQFTITAGVALPPGAASLAAPLPPPAAGTTSTGTGQ